MKRTRQKKAAADESRKRVEVPVVWYNGIAYVRTQKELAEFCGVSANTVHNVMLQGNLKPFIKANGNGKYFYDAMACMQEFKRLHIIATDEEKEIQRRFAYARRDMRTSFNMRMKKRGWPYRMYDGDYDVLEDDIIKVPEYISDEEVIAMAKEAGYDVEKVVGAYGFRAKKIREYLNNREKNEQEEQQVGADK